MMNTIKIGYKQTDIGVIPEDWEVFNVGHLGRFSKGSGISRAESQTGEIPSIRYGEIYTTHNDYIKDFHSFISVSVAKNARKLKTGDLLFTASGETKEEIGKCVAFIDNIEAYASGDILIISPDNRFNSLLLGFLLNAPYVVKQKANKGQGDAVVHITKDALSDIVIALPKETSEQTAIATALSDVDALIAALDKKITKKQQIKQGAMQQLLTGKKRLPGFSGEWVEKSLSEVAKIISGGTPNTNIPSYWDGEILWCTPTDITGNSGKYIVDTERKITKEGVKNSSTSLLPIGTLLLCSRATIGAVCIAGKIVTTNQGFKSLVCYENYSNEYLFYLIPSLKPQMLEVAIGSTFLEVSKSNIEKIQFVIPPTKSEQSAIAQILTDMDNEITQLEAERDKYKQLKAGMMQQLLTGKIRLVN